MLWLQHVDLRCELQAADLAVLGWAEADPSLQDSIHAATLTFPHVNQQPQRIEDRAPKTSDNSKLHGCDGPSRLPDRLNLPGTTTDAVCKSTSAAEDPATHLDCQLPGMIFAKNPADQQMGIPGPDTDISATAVHDVQALVEAPQNDQSLPGNSICTAQPSSIPSCTQKCPPGHSAKNVSNVQAEACTRNSTAMPDCAQPQIDSKGQRDKSLPVMPHPDRLGAPQNKGGISKSNSAGPLQATSSPQEIQPQSSLQAEVQPVPQENLAGHSRQAAANLLPGSGWHSSRRGKRKAAAKISQTDPGQPSPVAAPHGSLNTTPLYPDGSGKDIAHQLPNPERLNQIANSSKPEGCKPAQRQCEADATLPSQGLAAAQCNAHLEDLDEEATHMHKLPAAATQKLAQQLAELAKSCSAAALHNQTGIQKGTGMTSADEDPNASNLKGRRIAFVLQDDYHHTDAPRCHDSVSAGLQTGQYVLRRCPVVLLHA